MLAALESGVANAIVSVPPKHIICQAIPYHLQRISGLISWFPHAPRYRQSDDGRVVYQGNFDTVTDETRFSPIERSGGPERIHRRNGVNYAQKIFRVQQTHKPVSQPFRRGREALSCHGRPV